MKKKFTFFSSSGSAIGIVLGALMILSLLMYQILPNSILYSSIASNLKFETQSFNTALAAYRLQLLRFNLFFKLRAFVRNLEPGHPIKAAMGESEAMIDPIWNVPFIFPIPAIGDLTLAQSDAINEFVKNSSIKGEFSIQATGLGGKLNINDIYIGNAVVEDPNLEQNQELLKKYQELVENLQKQVEDIIIQTIQNSLDNNENFKKSHSNLRPIEIVDAIKDYIDPDNDRRQGGDEKSVYEKINLAPANRSMISITELHQIEGIDDEIYNLISPLFKVSFTTGINVNSADANFFKSFFPQSKDEDIANLIKQRDDEEEGHGPWTDKKAFIQDVQDYITTLPKSANEWFEELSKIGIEIVFWEESFEIQVKSTVGQTTRTFKSLIMDNTEYEVPKKKDKKTPSKSSEPEETEDGQTPEPKEDTKKNTKDTKAEKPKVIIESLDRAPYIITFEIL